MATADSSCVQVKNSGFLLPPWLISDSCSARKLEAGLLGRYSMSSDLMTSTMKSEPTGPLWWANSFGVPVSAAATLADGRSAEGTRGVAIASGAVAACAAVVAEAAGAATATPDRDLRGVAFGCGARRGEETSLG